MSNELKRLRIENNLKAADIVNAAKAVCPSFDKSMLSKCENGDKYGISIKPKIMDAIIKGCVPRSAEAIKKRIRGGHTKPHRISCRLDESDYTALQQLKTQGNHKNMSDMLHSIIENHINGSATPRERTQENDTKP